MTIPDYYGGTPYLPTVLRKYSGMVVADPWVDDSPYNREYYGGIYPGMGMFDTESIDGGIVPVKVTVPLSLYQHTDDKGVTTAYWYGEESVAHGCSAPGYYDYVGNGLSGPGPTEVSFQASRTAFATMCCLISGDMSIADAWVTPGGAHLTKYLTIASQGNGNATYASAGKMYAYVPPVQTVDPVGMYTSPHTTSSSTVEGYPGFYANATPNSSGTPSGSPLWYWEERHSGAPGSGSSAYIQADGTVVRPVATNQSFAEYISVYNVYAAGRVPTTNVATQPTTDVASTQSTNQDDAVSVFVGRKRTQAVNSDGSLQYDANGKPVYTDAGDPTTRPLFAAAFDAVQTSSAVNQSILMPYRATDASMVAKFDDLNDTSSGVAANNECQAVISSFGFPASTFAFDTSQTSVTWSLEGNGSGSYLDYVGLFFQMIADMRVQFFPVCTVIRWCDDVLLIVTVAYRTLRRMAVAFGAKRTEFVAPPMGPDEVSNG